jgi:tRNA/rRNA methyltransferase
MSRQYCIILCRPDESRNIGSVCRAMANAGIQNLRIVGCKEDYNDDQIRTLSIHAYHIWEKAAFYNTIKEAVYDCVIAAGTTRRKGKKRKEKLLLPEEFANHVSLIPSGNIALVFGNERTGLTDEELAACSIGITIPADDGFPSLNLSHAVQILTYSIFRAEKPRSPGYIPITMQRLEKTTEIISKNLGSMGFFTLAGREDMEQFWTSILARAALSEGEAAYMEKMFIKAAGLFRKSTEQ